MHGVKLAGLQIKRVWHHQTHSSDRAKPESVTTQTPPVREVPIACYCPVDANSRQILPQLPANTTNETVAWIPAYYVSRYRRDPNTGVYVFESNSPPVLVSNHNRYQFFPAGFEATGQAEATTPAAVDAATFREDKAAAPNTP